MTKLPVMAAADVIKKLKAGGFIFDRYAKGSHEIWYNPDTQAKRARSIRGRGRAPD